MRSRRGSLPPLNAPSRRITGARADASAELAEQVEHRLRNTFVDGGFIGAPQRSIDILREVHSAKAKGRPYQIVFVGVNGVGKSTNLSKVAYWLIQNGMKVSRLHHPGSLREMDAI